MGDVAGRVDPLLDRGQAQEGRLEHAQGVLFASGHPHTVCAPWLGEGLFGPHVHAVGAHTKEQGVLTLLAHVDREAVIGTLASIIKCLPQGEENSSRIDSLTFNPL